MIRGGLHRYLIGSAANDKVRDGASRSWLTVELTLTQIVVDSISHSFDAARGVRGIRIVKLLERLWIQTIGSEHFCMPLRMIFNPHRCAVATFSSLAAPLSTPAFIPGYSEMSGRKFSLVQNPQPEVPALSLTLHQPP